MKKVYFIILITLIVACTGQKEKKLDNIFYCFNNGVRTLPNAPVGFFAQSELIKRLGFDGLAGHTEDNYYELRAAMDKAGLEMPEMYIAMNIVDGKISYHKELKNIMINSKDRNLLITLHLHAPDFIDNRTEGDRLFVEGIRELADFAAPLNIKIAIYPHVNFYCEKLEFAVNIAKSIARKNVGVVYNLCHLLKVEGEDGWEEKATAALPYLFMVSINGADSGDTKNMGWDQLIQPLGEGTFDTYKLVKFFKDKGYQGKFGLQCYNIKKDCEVALTQSMKTWGEYQRRYALEK